MLHLTSYGNTTAVLPAATSYAGPAPRNPPNESATAGTTLPAKISTGAFYGVQYTNEMKAK